MPPGNFSFDEPKLSTAVTYRAPTGMVGFLLAKKIVTNETVANTALILFALMVAMISIFISIKAVTDPQPTGLYSPAPSVGR